ncbi:MAG: TonB-dependent receptor, partial [Rhodospirillaceae bacterium]|nr:TonB-dependent receptor [Rhodospirillaceae bacterium]
NGGGYITYYLCSGNIYDLTDPNHCFDPRKQYVEDTANRRITHEFRVHTDPARRWRVLGGVYFNDVETNHIGDFNYYSTNRAMGEHANNYYNDNSGDGFMVGNIAVPTDGVNTMGPRGPLTTFFNDFTRTESELSAFGEIAFDISDSVTASFSARSYDLDTALTGASNFSFGCRYGIGGFGNSHHTEDGRCNSHAFSNDVTARLRTLGRYNESGDDNIILDATSPDGARDMFRGGGSNQATLEAIGNGHVDIRHLNADGSITETDTIVKATLDWQARNDVLLFATYAEGYRPATLNRNAGQLSTNQTGVYENYVVPVVALTDNLTSFEVGVKSYLLDRSLRLNATYYRSFIDELQVSRFDPSNVAFLYFIENIGDAESSGLDVDFLWLPTGSLTIAGAFSVQDTELTRINPQLHGIAAPVGSELPMAPSFAGNLRLRYAFRLANAGADAYLSANVNYRGEMVSGIVGSAELMDDTLFHHAGAHSGLALQHEGGTFGTVRIPDGSGGRRLPANSRFVNPAATTLSVALGMERDTWGAELFVDNLNNESAPVMQIAGHYTPAITVQRPRTIGLRLSYDFE